MGQIYFRRTAQAVLDAIFWPLCILLATVGRYNFGDDVQVHAVLAVGVVLSVLQVGAGWFLGLYRGRYVYGSFEEVLGVSTSAAIAVVVGCIVGFVLPQRPVPLSALIVGGIGALVLMLATRYVIRAVAQRPAPKSSSAEPVIVLGAGEAGVQLVRNIERDASSPFRVAALLDDDPAKRRLKVGVIPVRGGREQLAAVARVSGAKSVIVAITGADAHLLQDVTTKAEACHLKVKVIPTLAELVSASVGTSDVRDLTDADLLGRRPITTDLTEIGRMIRGKRVLITGAGGSIGSELSRQVHRFGPKALGLLDRDESALHALQLSLHGRALLDDDSTILANIRDEDKIKQVFADFQPDLVFHAAALKHLPMLERYPDEAMKTNVFGTLNVLRAAQSSGVSVFVNISTDKAADPTSVLGFTKRIAERLTAGFAQSGGGARYVSVRFGNVLGSRGSVLTAFQSQIAAGGPVTVTDANVTRFFMTVSEAVQLVLQAVVVGSDGQALVLDMGEPVRIDSVARQLIARAGRPVKIVYTGLRNGEKLEEALFGRGEEDSRPVHPMVSHVEIPALHADDLHTPPVEDCSSLRSEMEAIATKSSQLQLETASPAAAARF